MWISPQVSFRANCWEYLYVLYKCSSVGCLKCVQLQNWFRLRIGSFQVNMERSAEYAFLNQLNYKSWWLMSWGRIYLCTDTWNSDLSCQGYTQKPILLKFWEKCHRQFCYSPTKERRQSGQKKLDIEDNRKKRKKENKKEGSKKDSQKNAYAHALKIIADFSHCHAIVGGNAVQKKKKGWQRNWGFVATNIPYFKAKILIQLYLKTF